MVPQFHIPVSLIIEEIIGSQSISFDKFLELIVIVESGDKGNDCFEDIFSHELVPKELLAGVKLINPVSLIISLKEFW